MNFESVLHQILKDNPTLSIPSYPGDNDGTIVQLFIKLFNKIPYIYYINGIMRWSKDINKNELYIKKINKEDLDENDLLIIGEHPKNNLDRQRTCNKIIETFPNAIIYPVYNYCFIIGDDFIFDSGQSVIFSVKPYDEKLLNCIINKNTEYPTMEWVSFDNRGSINTFTMDVISKGDIEGNYNDDLPNDRINQIIREDTSSIMILHGKPGTGKTNYIRNIISKNQDLKFYWLDSAMFTQINNAEFINFLINCKNGIFILEDCEVLLTERDKSGNGLLSSLLNISDGILGDSMHLKFICTFNADIQNIDKALLRKGRLKIKYEFKDLSKDKVQDLFTKLNIDKPAKSMPLCEIYNIDDNGTEQKEIRKVGFA